MEAVSISIPGVCKVSFYSLRPFLTYVSWCRDTMRAQTWKSHPRYTPYRAASWAAVRHFNYHMIPAQLFSEKRKIDVQMMNSSQLSTKTSIGP